MSWGKSGVVVDGDVVVVVVVVVVVESVRCQVHVHKADQDGLDDRDRLCCNQRAVPLMVLSWFITQRLTMVCRMMNARQG